MRRDDQVVLAGVDLEVMHRLGGHVAFHPVPRFAAVDRNMDREFGADKEQVRILISFADNVNRLVGQVGGDRRPGLAVVGRLVEEGAEIVVGGGPYRKHKPCRGRHSKPPRG